MDQRSHLIAQTRLARTEARSVNPESLISPANHATLPQVSDATTKMYM